MATVTIFGAINDVINKTAAEVVTSQVLPKTADIVSTFVKAGFEAAESVFTQIRDMTQPAPPPGP